MRRHEAESSHDLPRSPTISHDLPRVTVFSHKRFRRTARGYETDGAFILQMEALADHAQQVTLVVPVTDDALFRGEWLRHPHVEVMPLPDAVGRLGFLRGLSASRRIIRDGLRESDLALIVHPSYLSLLARWEAGRMKVPLVQWVVTDWAGGIRARRHADTPSVRAVAGVAARSAEALMRWATRGVLTFYTGRVLYHPGDPMQRLRFSSSLSQRALPEPSASRPLNQPPRVLYVGRLAGEKGLRVLLDAIALLPSAVDLVIVGEGDLEAALRAQGEALGITQQLHFRGFIPRGPALWAEYQAADLFVLPSLQEQQGKVLIEAMACGLPVIATQVGGLPEVLAHGERGLLVPAADPAALAEAMQRLLGDDALRRRLAASGLAWARERTVERETAWLVAKIAAALRL